MHFFASETIINKKRAVRQIILASTANIGYNVREKNQTGCARTSSAPPKSNDPFTTNIALKRGNLIETPSYMDLPIGRQPQRMLLTERKQHRTSGNYIPKARCAPRRTSAFNHSRTAALNIDGITGRRGQCSERLRRRCLGSD